jgi:hypothetical protein
LHFGEFLRHLGRDGETKTGCADLVERDAAQLAWQSDRAAGLVPDPGHDSLIGAHIGTWNVFSHVAKSGAKGAQTPLLAIGRHHRIPEDDGFGAAMWKTGCGIFEGHRACQAEAFLGADVGCHARTANRRTARRIVDDDDRLESDAGFMNVDNLFWAEPIGKSEHVLHAFHPHVCDGRFPFVQPARSSCPASQR